MKKMEEGRERALEEPTSILIVDDHVFLAEGIALALETSEKKYNPIMVHTFEAATAILKAPHLFDLVMLDLKMPGMMGLKSVKSIIKLAHPARVVLISGNAEPGVIQGSVRSGASGFIPKSLSIKSMMSVIDLILSGQIFLPASAAFDQYMDQESGIDVLNRLEREVLKLASEGFTNKEIANSIGASEVNVKMHMRNICRRLEARNRAHAVTMGIERQLI